MKIVDFISYLQNLGIKLWIEQEQLGCDAPKGVITPELKQDLIERKTEIIEFLRQGDKTQEQFIKQVYIDGKLPLSFAQERLWFLNQLFPNNPAYNVPIVLTIDGTLNVVALEQSLNAIIQRHETLRTTFSDINGKPVQIVAPITDLTLLVVDLQNRYSPQEQSEKVQQLVRQEAMALFDLAKGPMLRVTLLRLDPERHVLLITMHHIMCDLWSLGILVKELSSFYTAFSQGRTPILPELPIQYPDFAYWQRECFAGEVLEKQLNYWKKQLAGVSPVLKLPTDYPHPAQPTFKGGIESFQIDLDLTRKLRQLSQESESTLFMTLLSAFFVLLSRYSGQLDLVVGSPIANRNREETESLIGMFVNTLVLQADLSDNPTFKKLLNQVRETTLEAYAHQDLPFEKLVEELKIERNLSHNPLVQVAFALRNTKIEPWNLPGLRVSQRLDFDFTRFDLEVHLMEVSSGLEVCCNYSRDIFEPDTIDRMMKHFQVLLEAVVNHPEQRVLQLPIMTEVELDQILVEWNDTITDYPTDKCIHQLFEAQVQKTPDAVAVVFESQQLTYFELNCRANQLAHYLQSFGVKPEVLVGICVERSLLMIVGLLGILKAGGAYVPLDPNYPTSRLNYMIEDAQLSILLTQQKWQHCLPETAAQVICLDPELPKTASSENLTVSITSEHQAYMMYTSGSTGLPKGVNIRHQGVVRLVKNTNYITLTEEDIFLQLAPISFDAATLEIWGSLLNGGTLVVMPPHQPSLAEIGAAIRENKVTTLWLTAGLFQLMVEEQLENLLPVKQLLAGGDVLSVTHVQKVVEKFPGCQVINGYGPTENTTFTCCFPVKADSNLQKSVPIGKPISNTQVYILDSHLQPVPIGVAGELYVGGNGLAIGYHNRPELTAEKFIPNPFENSKATKLYKTGDLARYLRDGNIEFIGRIDHQVKVRGYRIETGEIEAVLNSSPQVKETVVVAIEDNPGEKRLVAYIVPETETTITSNLELSDQTAKQLIPQLREYLESRLPEYMIPRGFVVLSQLPLTPNGKVDRKALPIPDVASSVSTEYVAPQTQTQKVLAEIWQEVLAIEKVGIHDNFFDLGGHSLLATQVVSRIQQAFAVECPLKTLFETPELASLAQKLEKYLAASEGVETIAIAPRVKDGNPPPLSFAQQRLWFIEKMALSSNAYNMPLTLHLVGQLDYLALQKSLNQIIARHETLRTTFSEINSTAVQIIKPPFELQLAKKDLRGLTPSEATNKLQQLLQQENQLSFNLEVDPPIRASLYQLETTEHILQITLHHIASDGWSLTVLSKELSAIYTATVQDQPSPLPPLPIQYADFAVWQRNYLQGETLENQLNYWKQKLQDLPQLQLPTDHPRPPVQTFNGAGIPINIPAAVTSKVKQLSQNQGTTLFMTLLAAFKVLLSRYSGQENIAIGTPIANRNRTEIEGLIGFFVNSLVMYTDLGGSPSFTEVLNRVKQTALEAYTHQDIPFEKLVEELQPQRSLSQNPLFQVMFAVQQEEILKPSFNLPNLEIGLGWERWMGDLMTVRMDIELHLWPAGEEIKGFCAYNRDLFEAKTISRMLSHYQNLLSAAVETPEQPISQLPLMTEPELDQILVEWNNTITDYPKDKCIHQLFEAQVEKSPDSVAVVFEEQKLTYWELNSKANQLAHYLQKLGVVPETLVGICVERSIEMVVGLFAILKAGGAYVALEPNYPASRLAQILEDGELHLVLTDSNSQFHLPETKTPIININQANTVEIQANVVSNINSQNLAYVLYTSGSTGRPKGVAIEHRSPVSLLHWAREVYSQEELSGVLASTSICFDLSVFELFVPLSWGGKVILAENALHLAELPAAGEVSLINTVPSAARELVRNQSIPTGVKTVNLAGEPLDNQLVQQLYEQQTIKAVYNLYGPSEDTTYSTYSLIEKGATKSPTIGRPIANTQVYIFNAHLQPVPIGVAGELHIGGEGLARSYLKQAELTAEKFIFWQGKRLYKTGDLVSYLPDGNIEFLGRIDNQVKIRGYRIETGEIQGILNENPKVKETVVVAREDNSGNKGLVAYIVLLSETPEGSQTEQIGKLKQYLKERLPEYMIPSGFVLLPQLPLTPNGKVDRKALPVPDVTSSVSTEYVAPQTETQKALAEIWQEVLGIEQVGIHDNFFDLGGHSLTAVKLVSKISTNFNISLPVKTLFLHPTMAELSNSITEVIKNKNVYRQQNNQSIYK
ncbi:hypothetical protein BJP34_14815 [Moorena producens PAL-8-15-08-1]|uniref:Carrier domain-containing protein n=1 Tax=Moorena producens PAL-8-15-08-1 TaxID=1458985 RepID=A0A1D8TSX3_9CYAN|nr:non-ribosomal peptide synthetase [Moorena producens]AOX00546.1 hypothetical protein BJP34_14815 [Moorena producens PAL-8-15-08-1]